MTDAHENDSEESEDELMRRIVLGECEPDAPEVRRRAAEDGSFARELEDWRLMRERLDSAFDEDRAIVDGATGQVEEADRRLVLSSLGGELAGATSPRFEPGVRRGWMVALAATLLAALALFLVRPWEPTEVDPTPSGVLGSELCDAPAGEVPPDKTYAPFEVDYALPAGGSVLILVEDALTGEVLARSGRLKATSWSPDGESARQIEAREHIRWHVTIRPTPTSTVEGFTEAWRP